MKSTVYELMKLSESSEEEGFDEEDLVAEPEEEEEKEPQSNEDEDIWSRLRKY